MPFWSKVQRLILRLTVAGLSVPRVAAADPPQGGLAELVAAAKRAVVYIVVATNSGAQSSSGFDLNPITQR